LTRLRGAMALAAVLALLGAQAAIAALAVFAPHPDAAYRATYLDHTADCWRPNLDAPASLGDADVIVPRILSASVACAVLPKGWLPPDDWGVWSNGALARIDLPIRPGDNRVTFRFRGYAPDVAQRLTWSLPGTPARSLDIPPTRLVPLTVTVPPGQDRLRLTLRIQHVHKAMDQDVRDWRAIGVALIDITRSP
jgi:hypothetical protein